jgi:iron complex outermembrane receptor protein
MQNASHRPLARPRSSLLCLALTATALTGLTPVRASYAQTAPQPTASGTPAAPVLLPGLTVEGERTAFSPVEGYRARRSITGSKGDSLLSDTPASVQVVPHQVLEDQNAGRTSDALKNVSGITSATGSYRYFNDFTIRGFLLNGNNYFRDGLRDDSFSQSQSLYGVERVEVLKGPASLLYGASQPGGSLNFISKLPTATPAYQVDVGYGTDNHWQGMADASGPLTDNKSIRYRLIAAIDQTDRFIDNMDSTRRYLNGTVQFGADRDTTFTLQGEYREGSEPNFYGVPAYGTVDTSRIKLPRSRSFQEPSDSRDYFVVSLTGTLDHRFNDIWSSRTQLRATMHEFEYSGYIPSSLNATRTALNRNYTLGKQEPYSYSFDTNLTGKFDVGDMPNTLIVGVQSDYSTNKVETYRQAGALPAISLTNPVYGTRPTALAIQNNYTGRNFTKSLYAQNQLELTPQFQVIVGARLDSVDQDLIDYTSKRTLSREDTEVTGRYGLIYKPTSKLSFYTAYSQSYLPNSPSTLDRNGANFGPESGTQVEAGMRYDLLPGLTASAAVFQIDRTDALATDPLNATRAVQIGEQRSRGVEVDVTGEITKGWNVIGNYTYVDAKIRKDTAFKTGNEMPNVAKHSARLWSVYDYALDDRSGLGIGAGVNWVGSRQGDLGNTFKLASYTVVDGLLYYRYDGLKISLNATNLLDEEYIEGSTSAVRVYQGEPRQVMLRLSSKF